uniref:ZP domain-containing protein n=1 Tax=Steinernema glaseri TaxID=37863 RepID=A0A1I7ZK41_9BILA
MIRGHKQMISVFCLDVDRPLRPLRRRYVFDCRLLIRRPTRPDCYSFAANRILEFVCRPLLMTTREKWPRISGGRGARQAEQVELLVSAPEAFRNGSILSTGRSRRSFDGRYVMGGHRRDQSESHMPLRESDFQMSIDSHGQELQVRVVNEELSSIPVGGGAIANGSANVSAAYADPCDPAPHDGPPPRGCELGSCESVLFARIDSTRSARALESASSRSKGSYRSVRDNHCVNNCPYRCNCCVPLDDAGPSSFWPIQPPVAYVHNRLRTRLVFYFEHARDALISTAIMRCRISRSRLEQRYRFQ